MTAARSFFMANLFPRLALSAGSIVARLARRAGLEALVQPQVLLRHRQDALLDEGVHPPSIALEVLGRKILPRGVELQHVTLRARQLARDRRHDRGAGHPRDARKTGDGRRLDAE